MNLSILKDGAWKDYSNGDFVPVREFFSVQEIRLGGVSIDITDGNAWLMLLNDGIITQSFYSKGDLLQELVMSTEDVPTDVLHEVIRNGRQKNGLYKKLDVYLSYCNNQNSLNYLLRNGAKFKYFRGHGESTMWKFVEGDNLAIAQPIRKYPKSWHKSYIRKNKKKIMARALDCAENGKKEESYLLSMLVLNS